MTKADRIDAIADKLKFPWARAELLVDAVFGCLEQSMSRGEKIEIRATRPNYPLYPDPETAAKPAPVGCQPPVPPALLPPNGGLPDLGHHALERRPGRCPCGRGNGWKVVLGGDAPEKNSQNDPPPDPPLVRGGAWRSVTLGDGKSPPRHKFPSRNQPPGHMEF
jgi:hypothetical protein